MVHNKNVFPQIYILYKLYSSGPGEAHRFPVPFGRYFFPMEFILKTLSKKEEVDSIIRDTIDKVLVLRFGRSSDPLTLHLDDILYKSVREVSKFATVALVDIDSEDVQVYVKYFDITLIPSTIFFFNAHHMKMDSGSADHTKWVGAFQRKQDFIDVVEAIFRGAMKGKLIVTCPLPPERIPKFQLLYKDV